ncbi:MAG: UDP-N-acetylmuramoyl-L-alanine--D-glutamate ligase [Erysipelotrichaceae bacterium]|nr:UDP-N-acetylmuramoyl-L-alanine--D-glutamate ligase [Erysipelotrichaceae bacterium]
MENKFENKRVLVIGLARSGMAAIKVLHKLGASIVLSEMKEPKKEDLDYLKSINVEIKDQSMEAFEEDYDLVIKNPGVPPVSPIVKRLNERKIPVITEIELAYQISKPQHYVAITGTNGKTTTTTLVYELLHKAFKDKAHVGGNIGTPLCELVLDYNLMEEEGHYISLEISNHQLVDIIDFEAEISTIINLTPDHLSTMGTLDAYYKSKTEVYRNSKGSDLFIYNNDDPVLKEYTDRYPINCEIKTFSLENDNADAYIKDGYMIIDNEKVLPTECIKLVGMHNKQNIIIAIMAAKRLGISNEDIYDVISNFKGVEHRIEFVKEVNGVKYYNDSKGTNTDATITALKAFDKNVILIVGGFEKGLSMEEMKKYLKPVKKVIGFGVAGKRIAGDLVDNPIIVTTLDEAVNEAYKMATDGDIVLLSPTTSSFDQYSGYEERGRHFKKLVNEL